MLPRLLLLDVFVNQIQYRDFIFLIHISPFYSKNKKFYCLWVFACGQTKDKFMKIWCHVYFHGFKPRFNHFFLNLSCIVYIYITYRFVSTFHNPKTCKCLFDLFEFLSRYLEHISTMHHMKMKRRTKGNNQDGRNEGIRKKEETNECKSSNIIGRASQQLGERKELRPSSADQTTDRPPLLVWSADQNNGQSMTLQHPNNTSLNAHFI